MLKDAGHPRALLAPVVAQAFHMLGAVVTLRADDEWYVMSSGSTMLSFELEFGVEARRWPYNERCFAQARRERKTVIGEHAGFFDLFTPVVNDKRVHGVLVAGPFARERPSARQLFERWRWLTGGYPNPSDQRFLEYLARTCEVMTLEGAHWPKFRRLLECFAALMGGQGDESELSREAAQLRDELEPVRVSERMNDAVRSLLDARTSRAWATRFKGDELERIGLSAAPECALVALAVPREAGSEPVDELVRRDGFRRGVAALLLKLGEAACAPLGEQGLSLLVNAKGRAEARRGKLLELGQRVTQLGRSFGLQIHLGVGPVRAASLIDAHEAARAAAERALAEGQSLLQATARQSEQERPLAGLRRELGRLADARQIQAAFTRFAEAAARTHGYRLEPLRLELEFGMDRLLDTPLTRGVLDEKSSIEIKRDLARQAGEVRGARELLGVYQGAAQTLADVVLRPRQAIHDRSLQRALTFMNEHLGEPITLAEAARASGFAPGYFSKLFKREHGVTFEQFLRSLRVSRARELLHNTQLAVEQVGKLCGFGKRTFHEAFKAAEGMTPLEYRERTWWAGASAHDLEKPRHALGKKRRSG